MEGTPVALRFTVNGLCAMEEASGKPLSALLDGGFSGLRWLLWCGLLPARPGLTPEHAGDIMQDYLARGGTLEELSQECAKGLTTADFFRGARA